MANQLENIAGLQSILETVNSLPEAGSGGGGRLVNLTISGFVNTAYPPYYVSEDGVTTITALGTYKCVAPSIYVMYKAQTTMVNIAGDVSALNDIGSHGNSGYAAYSIYGDCTITVIPGGSND